MKGTIFVELLNLVEDAHGLDMVDAIIDRAGDALSTGGAYTGVGNYPHAELLALVGAAAEITGAATADLLETFAGHLLGVFRRMHPEFFDPAANYLSFLETLQLHVHVEVLKIYPEAAPPTLHAERLSATELQLDYNSHRPLAAFAAALARQGAQHFATKVTVETIGQAADGCSAKFMVRVLS